MNRALDRARSIFLPETCVPRLPITSPIKGINRVVNREGQPPDACWDAQNMLPYDRFGRRRVAQRHGLTKWSSTNIGSTFIKGMIAVNAITYANTLIVGSTFPINSFTNVPGGVSTSGNSVSFPASFLGTGSDTGPAWTGVVPSTGVTLDFDVTVSGADAFAEGISWWVAFNSTAHTFSNIFTSTHLCFSDSEQYASGTDIVSQSNLGGGEKFLFSGNPPPPANGVPFHVTLTWDSGGNVSANIPGVVNQDIPPDMPVVPFGSGSTLQFYGQTGSNGDTLLTLSNIVLGTGVTVSTGAVGYKTILVAVCGGYVWVGDSFGNFAKAAHGQATPQVNSTNVVSMCVCEGIVFIADGVRLISYTVATDTVAIVAAVASPGNITGTVPPNCSLVANWRGRIVLAGDSGNPQNYYMSRPPGTYFNTVTLTNVTIAPGVEWDFSQTDPAAAFAGNLASGNQIGEPITALIPFSNDYLKLGCSHSLWMMQGDPANGGTIVNVSQGIGIVYKDAWCIDPAGTLWFVGTGGLFQVRPAWEFYRPPEPVSLQNVNQFFTSLNPSSTATTLVYDPDLHFLHLFMTPQTGAVGLHLTMDARSVGGDGPPAFFPQVFPSNMGPTCAVTFYADASPNNRNVLLGGTDGFVRSWNEAATNDDGLNISSYVVLGPFAPVPGAAATLTGTTLDMGEVPNGFASSTWGATAFIYAGPDAWSVTEGVASNLHAFAEIGMLLDKRQKTFRQRLRGGWFTIKLANGVIDQGFSLESGVLDFIASGPNRLLR